MTNEIATRVPEPVDDDGFSGSFSSRRHTSNYLRWTDARGWEDRDGLKPPEVMLVGFVAEGIQRWEDKVPKLITDKPLPDPDELNAAIPVEQWPDGINGKDPPWKAVVVIGVADPAT